MNWLLPEYLADALPAEAARIERLRRTILDHFRGRGYELVVPPMLEYLESLLTGAGQDLKLRTFKLVDQLSGRTMGVRADITPQAARIDAHLLNHEGVTRLCYCGSVLHTLPATISAGREPIQIGAELYGFAGIEADLDVIRLMAGAFEQIKLPVSRIDLGHVGIFQALAEAAGLPKEAEDTVLSLLQAKDVPGLAEACADFPSPYREAMQSLPLLYGGAEVLERAAAELPALPAISLALDGLRHVLAGAPELPFSIDLSDLRGYHYHNGVVFAAYCPDYPAAIALGGRYDGAGKAFGRARPATGFSMDLREVARLAPAGKAGGAILAPHAGHDGRLSAHIKALRDQGEIVVQLLPGETACEGPVCDRKLALVGEHWIIEAIQED
ncbi:MAG: ATP phosphoribosyltransferase regulatory subunit [Gammaproteobacteria bacterium]|nr:ATP phosphoribosyltransferase regulatory subunit [Gammaproteobacteria bacterium]MBU1601610.1 ATP phosphoribosyltransferase regulatory subunit [Gammaproteobacteria bacterium]MBU2434688.1 ATP phosphoribosyltransferase regulatory subunit [Gammaproteobacteria bacterium]MBU2447929.1 ATP phosphoribosyltransferase regulatory subunit [Gammaproteobacteria bacterium]